MASAAAFLFFFFGDEGERGWVGPETSSVMVALRSDFVRGSAVGGLAASSSSPLLSPPYPGGPEVTGHWFILFSFLFPFPQF